MEDGSEFGKLLDHDVCGVLLRVYLLFFQSWFHTFLVKARGYSENGLLLSSLPLVVAGCANLGGGLATNALVKKLGLK